MHFTLSGSFYIKYRNKQVEMYILSLCTQILYQDLIFFVHLYKSKDFLHHDCINVLRSVQYTEEVPS